MKKTRKRIRKMMASLLSAAMLVSSVYVPDMPYLFVKSSVALNFT